MNQERKSVLMGYVGGDISKAVLDRSKKSTLFFERPNGERGVLYHKTIVVLHDSRGRIVLNSGGWRTPTTKERINTQLPAGYGIWQTKGVWYLHGPENSITPFYDGISITPGEPVKMTKKAEIEELRQKKLAKKILKLVAKIDDNERLPQTSTGDCLLCQFGDAMKDTDHLMSHVKEGYLHGSLIVNALRWSGLSDQGIGLHYAMNLKKQVKNTLRRYLREKLGLAR